MTIPIFVAITTAPPQPTTVATTTTPAPQPTTVQTLPPSTATPGKGINTRIDEN